MAAQAGRDTRAYPRAARAYLRPSGFLHARNSAGGRKLAQQEAKDPAVYVMLGGTPATDIPASISNAWGLARERNIRRGLGAPDKAKELPST